MLILELAEHSAIQLIGSQMLVKEIQETPDKYKCAILQMIYSLCTEEILVDRSILTRAANSDKKGRSFRTNGALVPF